MPYFTDRKMVLQRLAANGFSVGFFIYLMVDNGFYFDRGTTGIVISVLALLCFAVVLSGFITTAKAFFHTSPRIEISDGNLAIRQSIVSGPLVFPIDELQAVELLSGRIKFIKLRFKDTAKSFHRFNKGKANPETINNGAIAKNGLRISLSFVDVDFEQLKSELEAAQVSDVSIVGKN